MPEKGCLCQRCGKEFKVDFLVDGELWEKIKPTEKPAGGGILCGECVVRAIENFGKFGAYQIVKQT